MRLIWLILGIVIAIHPAYSEVRTQHLFDKWHENHINEVGIFTLFLKSEKLDKVLPLHQLLRTASSWEGCNAAPFEVPPPENWQGVFRTLHLLDQLKKRGILTEFEIHSAYRNAELNVCAGGAPSSAHQTDFAIDLTTENQPELADKLCDFWRKEGKAWQMGLSRYASGRIHIDTKRFRTWGNKGDVPYCLAKIATE